jgi:hypothetical protein
MATWKKVIVSGSNAELNQITASGGIDATLPNQQRPNFVTYDTTTGQFGYFNTGSLTASTASYITASGVVGPYGPNSVISSSYAVASSTAISSSYAFNASTATSASVAGFASTAISSSFATNASTASSASFATSAANATTASYATFALTANTASYLPVGTYLITASWANNVTSASYAFNASNAVSSSYAVNASTATSASFATSAANATTASYATFAISATSASFATNAATASTASFATAVSSIASNVSNNTDNRVLTATGGGTINGETNLTFDGTTLAVTGNATISGDLTVAGTASFQSTQNLLVADRYILFASGSTTTGDGGFVVQQGTQNQGILFGYNAANNRFGVTSSFSATNGATTFTPKAFASLVEVGSVDVTIQTASYGGASAWCKMFINSASGDIFIFS